jgi:nicotinate-nucleotide pyrophosphorylase (carboxylating)
MLKLTPEDFLPLLRMALEEDIGPGDATSLATVPFELEARAMMVARQSMTVCGLTVAQQVFHEIDPNVTVVSCVMDGRTVTAGEELLHIVGPARSILTAERTALNFVQRLSGVATQTARYVQAIAGTKAKVLDTRKTTPGWRKLEKYAVSCGGGANHRVGLYDLILIKDNHLAALRQQTDRAIMAAVERSREAFPNLKIEVEADTLEDVSEAVESGADIILLDNMPPDVLRQALKLIDGRAKSEASGGITLQTIRAVAETGVDYISVGALTHSAISVDVALDFVSAPASVVRH